MDKELAVKLKMKADQFIKETGNAKGAANSLNDTLEKTKRDGAGGFSGLIGNAKKLSPALKTAGAAALTLGAGVLAIGGGAVAGLALLTGGAMRLASQAAPLQAVAGSFDALASGFEGGSPAMLAALQDSSAGMIRNIDLMTSFNKAAQLVSKDFAQQLPSAMEHLAKVSASTGESLDFLLDSFVVGVGRGSQEILDNLGITVTATEAYKRFAEANGLAADSLTKNQQQMAVASLAIEKLEQNTASLPSVYGSASQAFTSFNVSLQNATDQIGLDLLPTMSRLVNIGKRLMPTFQAIGQGLAGVFSGIVDVGIEFVKGLAGALGINFDSLASNSEKWGQNVVLQFARGMASAAQAVIQVLNQIGQIITYWLQPHSPPKLLPNIDTWGRGAAEAWLGGFNQADVGTLRDLSGMVETALRSSMAGMDSTAIAKGVLEARKKLEDAFKSGGNILGALPNDLKAYGQSLLSVKSAELAVAAAQEKLNKVTADYDSKLKPLNAELAGIAKQRQKIIDDQRKAELESVISDENAPALAKELAQMELREIELKNQVGAIEDQKKTAVDSATEQLNAAQTLLDAEKEKLDIQKQLLAQEQEMAKLLADTVAQTNALSSALGGGAGGSGIGGALESLGVGMEGLIPLSAGLGNTVSELGQQIQKEFSAVKESAFGLGVTWGEVVQNMRKWWQDNINATIEQSPLLSWLSEHIPTALGFLRKWWDRTWELIAMYTEAKGKRFLNQAEFFAQVLLQDLPNALVSLRKFWERTFAATTKAVRVAKKNMIEMWEEMKVWLAETLPTVVAELAQNWLDGFSIMSNKVNEVGGVVLGFWENVKGLWQWLQNHVFSFNIQTPNFPALPFSGGGDEDAGSRADKGQSRRGLAPSVGSVPVSAGMSTASGGGAFDGVNIDLSGATINEPMDLQMIIMAVTNAVKQEMRQ